MDHIAVGHDSKAPHSKHTIKSADPNPAEACDCLVAVQEAVVPACTVLRATHMRWFVECDIQLCRTANALHTRPHK